MPALPASLLRWTVTDFMKAEREGAHIEPLNAARLLPGAPEGVLVSPPASPRESFVEAIASWQATAPEGTQIEVALRAELDGRWTRWWTMGLWSSEQSRRFSVEGQVDADGTVATDTLVLRQPARSLQWRVVLRGGAGGASPLLRGIGITTSPAEPRSVRDRPFAVPPLPVPEISQMTAGEQGPDLCSAASLTMILQYWYAQTRDDRLRPYTASDATERLTTPSVYDPVYDGAGNWAFNTAFAASLGLEAYVARFNSLAELSRWTAAGVPLVASIAFEPGALEGAPIAASPGHLLVVVGFTDGGDVIVNEPRCDTRTGGQVRHAYRADQFKLAWQSKGRGTVYLIYPPGWI